MGNRNRKLDMIDKKYEQLNKKWDVTTQPELFVGLIDLWSASIVLWIVNKKTYEEGEKKFGRCQQMVPPSQCRWKYFRKMVFLFTYICA